MYSKIDAISSTASDAYEELKSPGSHRWPCGSLLFVGADVSNMPGIARRPSGPSTSGVSSRLPKTSSLDSWEYESASGRTDERTNDSTPEYLSRVWNPERLFHVGAEDQSLMIQRSRRGCLALMQRLQSLRWPELALGQNYIFFHLLSRRIP